MSWVSVAVFIASNSDVMCHVTMCAGHGLYKQFTRLFLFLQKWVWLARLTAAVPASFRFQEFKSSKSSFDSEDVKSVMKMAN